MEESHVDNITLLSSRWAYLAGISSIANRTCRNTQILSYCLAAVTIALSLSLLIAPRTRFDPTMMAGVPDTDS